MKFSATGVIPIKSHLKKFLLYRENISNQDPVNLNRPGSLPFVLLLLFEGKTNIDEAALANVHKNNELTSKYDDTFRYSYTVTMRKTGRFFVSTNSIRAFNLFLHRAFVEFLVDAVEFGQRFKVTEKEVMIHYFKEMGISTSSNTFESTKRALSRARKSKKKPNLHTAKSKVTYFSR